MAVKMNSNNSSPSTFVVFVVLVIVRILSAIYNNINDCDETYNYWEPAHFILHGTGFQTWEYSPIYAVRSYAYILIHVIPIVLLTSLSKIIQFYSLRVILAVVCSVCETYLYSVIKRRMTSQISLWFFLFLVSSCGMYISSTAFLPSSFTMYCTMVSMAAWLDHKEHIAIFAVALGSILGWPFVAALGIPLAVDVMIRQKRVLFFFACSLISLLIIGGPVLLIDSWMYGRVVFTPLNIILYNVFGKGGPDLYGTEPWTYYFVNGFLNLNFTFVLCLLCFPLVELKIISDHHVQKMPKQLQQQASIYRPIIITVLIWFAIFFTRPHKEERFLFPIYPLVCLCASISLHLLNELVQTIEYILRLSKSTRMILNAMAKIITIFLLFTHAILGMSRILILYNGYNAPIKIYSHLSITAATQSQREVNVCVGKEWYRFPSSFFLPNTHLDSKWNLRFIQSEFRGQLPKPYSSLQNATAIIPTNMNDMNREEIKRYFNIDDCHYLIDMDGHVFTEFEPHYHSNTAVWEPVYSTTFLDSSRSPQMFRAFYIPWASSELVKYVNYYLLQNRLL